MPALQIKDCPSDVYESLRTCAAEENRSISQQALNIIRGYLAARDSAQGQTLEQPQQAQGPSQAGRLPGSSLYAASIDETDYLAKRERSFKRIDALKPLPVTKKAPSAAALLAQVRSEESR